MEFFRALSAVTKYFDGWFTWLSDLGGTSSRFEVTGVDVVTMSTVVIAIFTVLLFVWQYRQLRHSKLVANADIKFALYEKRLSVFLS